MIAAADWVAGWATTVGLVVGLFTLTGFIVAGLRWIFLPHIRVAIREEVEPIVAPLRYEITELDTALREHMAEETTDLAEFRVQLADHIEDNRQEFAETRDWRAGTDIALRNIQQATVPEPSPRGTPRRRKTDRPFVEGG